MWGSIRSRALVFLLGLLMLVPSGLLSGCGEGGSNAIQVMKWFPATGNRYVYVNLAALREPQYSTLYQGVASGVSDLALYGISLDDVSWFARLTNNDTSAIMLGGNFDFIEIKRELDKAGNRASYKGVEIWTGLVGGQALFIGNGLILGGNSANVYECIDVIKGMKESLYDNRDLRDAISRFSQTVILSIATEAGQYFPTNVANCDAAAYGYDKIDAENMEVTFVGKFKDATTAGNSISDFKGWATTNVSYSLEHVQAVQEGEFIKVTATFPSSEWTWQTVMPVTTPTPMPQYIYQYFDTGEWAVGATQSVLVHSVAKSPTFTIAGGSYTATVGAEFVWFEFTITNIRTEPNIVVGPGSFWVNDSLGREYWAIGSQVYYPLRYNSITIYPGETAKGLIPYIVPTDATGLQINHVFDLSTTPTIIARWKLP